MIQFAQQLVPIALLTLSAAPSAGPVEWLRGPLEPAVAAAAERGTHVLVYFWADGSDFCARVWGETLSDESAQADLADYVCLSADVTTPDGSALMQRFGVSTLPTVLLLTSAGEPDDAVIGYHARPDILLELRRVLTGAGTVSAMRRDADAAPGDMALRYQLAQKLIHVGRRAEGNALVASIREQDPKGETLMGARLNLWDLMARIQGAASSPEALAEFDLEPMSKHLRRAARPEVAFEGWTWIATIERERGETRKAREALASAWPHSAPDDRFGWWNETAGPLYWNDRDSLTGREKKLALKMAATIAGDLETALAAGDAGASAADAAVAFESLARMHWLNGQRDAAREAAGRALEFDPANAAALATHDLVAKSR